MTRLQPDLRVLILALQGEDATVTVVHSKTKDAREICAEADILIAAIGKAEMVKADWVKPGAAVIDVGTNPIPVRTLQFTGCSAPDLYYPRLQRQGLVHPA